MIYLNYKTHTVGGTLAGISVFNIITNNLKIVSLEGIAFMSGSVIGSLIPDIDHRKSYIGRKAKITSAVLNKTLGHRGVTHSPIIMTIFIGIMYMLTKLIIYTHLLKFLFIGLLTGVISHIFLDFLTKGGIPLLYPFNKKRFSLLRISTNGFMENIIFVIMILGSGFLLIKNCI